MYHAITIFSYSGVGYQGGRGVQRQGRYARRGGQHIPSGCSEKNSLRRLKPHDFEA